MTVVYPYFRHLIDSERHKSYIFYYFSGPTDVKLICEPAPSTDWEIMAANQVQDKNEGDNNHPKENGGKGDAAPPKPSNKSENIKPQEPKQPSKCKIVCENLMFSSLVLLLLLLSIVEMAMTVTTAITTKIYTTDLSGRVVAMSILAVTGAIALCMTICAILAACRKKHKSMHGAATVLIVLAIIQAVIAGVAVQVTAEDEYNLSRSLALSFKLEREDNPRHIKIWSTTQHDLSCCGIFSPEDYRSNKVIFFPPDVPISCCPAYNPGRSELVQERERELCKSKKQYYTVGCQGLVLEVFSETAAVVLAVTIVLIVLEILLAISCYILSRRHEKNLNWRRILSFSDRPKVTFSSPDCDAQRPVPDKLTDTNMDP